MFAKSNGSEFILMSKLGMDNQESLLSELDEFESSNNPEITDSLEKLLQHIARTGETLFPWIRLKSLFKFKLLKAMDDFHEEYPGGNTTISQNIEVYNYFTMKQKIVDQLDSFNNAPFTIQRLCELITDPKKHYTRSDKFVRGIEKNVLVVSTDDFSKSRKNEEGHLVNGVVEHWTSSDSFNGNSNHVTMNYCDGKLEKIDIDEPGLKTVVNSELDNVKVDAIKSPDQEDMDTTSEDKDCSSESKSSEQETVLNETADSRAKSNDIELDSRDSSDLEANNNDGIETNNEAQCVENPSLMGRILTSEQYCEEDIVKLVEEKPVTSCDVSGNDPSSKVVCENGDSQQMDGSDNDTTSSQDNRRKIDELESSTDTGSEVKKRKYCEDDNTDLASSLGDPKTDMTGDPEAVRETISQHSELCENSGNADVNTNVSMDTMEDNDHD